MAALRGNNGVKDNFLHAVANTVTTIDAMASRLPTLSPEAEVDLLEQAGFARPELFYAAFTFKGWVAYAGL